MNLQEQKRYTGEELKKKCHWGKGIECKLLCETQCIKNKKCTFHETDIEIEQRLKPYNEMVDTYRERINMIGKALNWKQSIRDKKLIDLLKKPRIERDKVLNLLEKQIH